MNRAADWFRQAEADLRAAEDSIASAHYEWAAFQAQHTAEKAVKALVQFLHGATRGQSITEILQQLPASVPAPPTVLDAARRLDRVYLTSIPTDTLVYSETDFVRLRDDPESFVSQNLPSALEL